MMPTAGFGVSRAAVARRERRHPDAARFAATSSADARMRASSARGSWPRQRMPGKAAGRSGE